VPPTPNPIAPTTVWTGSAAPDSILDLGCGNGWLLTAAMRATGASRGTGVDVSKAAVASARATAEANGIDVDIVLGDAADPTMMTWRLSATFDLIVLNPPFHQGTTIETDTAEALMATAAAHLAPGGQVITVFNTHLRYRDRLESHHRTQRAAGPEQEVHGHLQPPEAESPEELLPVGGTGSACAQTLFGDRSATCSPDPRSR
jgi:methylase of polypeptide subunit release factors